MNFRLLDEAQAEYDEAICYYFAVDPDLAIQFITEIEQAIVLICDRPLLRPIIRAELRRHLIKRFHVGIYYSIREDTIVIWAIMDQRRNPSRWQRRKL